jgi:hypothetical protein
MLRLARAACVAAPVLATGGCLSGSSTLPATATLTMITVDPAAFVGSATCGTRLRRYVVTLTDVTDGSRSFFSSAPTPCTELVSFTERTSAPLAPPGISVVVGDSYIGTIDGYDRDDISSDPSSDAGFARTVVDDAGQPVLPRWTTTCGQPAATSASDASDEGGAAPVGNPLLAPVQAKASTEVFLLGCIPFTDALPEPDGGADATDDASQGGG